ncbi:MAG TPA: BamA/TamA family outer membrane protein [Xanthomonadales bacterium]|nr:BamA/TamA family outer membrane protein [Xanthomonadales bacterium]
MKTLVLISTMLFCAAIAAEELGFEIRGLDSALLNNALANIANLDISEGETISQRRIDRFRLESQQRVLDSLKPYGYYNAQVTTQVIKDNDTRSTIVLEVKKGPPVIVRKADIRVDGPGVDFPEIQDWLKEWPLPEGAVLNQSLWENAKQLALDRLDYNGYLSAQYTEHRIEVDLDSNEAVLALALDTGPRATLGEVRFEQDVVRPLYLQQLVRFDPGQPYDGWLIERLRFDLWKTGFFSTIDVLEERDLEADPPVVNLNARLEARNRDTWQSSLGVGSDTEIRGQLNWDRHWLSDRGDSLGMGLGWQQRDDRFLFRTNYRLPRGSSRRSYWIAETLYRDENQDFQVSPEDQPGQIIDLTTGDLETYLFKGGILNIRDIRDGYQQINETWFVQYLRENVRYDVPDLPVDVTGQPLSTDSNRIFSDDNSSVAFGVEWDWPVINGQGFETTGHHERLQMFTANDIWGSFRDFNQIYFSTRWNFMAAERIKILLRAELGYSDAEVDEFDLTIDDQVINISLTELPNFYRFRAGGSQSVRGYSFESLSNNGIGSNNLITFSAEAEWLFRENWSLATFYDVGNAFNDWDETSLKSGAGFGIRWYSIAGAVRLDFASGLDLPDDPWRIHFTLGVPLL